MATNAHSSSLLPTDNKYINHVLLSESRSIGHFKDGYTLGVLYISYSVMDDQQHK